MQYLKVVQTSNYAVSYYKNTNTAGNRWTYQQSRLQKETLKWVHIFISNAKRNLIGNYNKIKRKNLQLYLDEFVYKLNRRYFGEKLFDRLVISGITAVR